ncbi:hypothetical protein [uncultured Tateyamaria sp.]|uniref:hypothetical protein n=1 Tax=uncultured Tateyamaria sp. TaxID=455651 RepID=UPI0026367C34|nr:hypothetical protein [uncultured Tateyamaria sp.]
MIRCILLLYLVVIGPAVAQQVTVRSGAHEDFARLVLNVPQRMTWSIEQDERGALLALDGHDDGFDTSSVFDRIRRTFISDVSSDGSSIRIDFACECSATVFNEGSSMIVVDVAEASTPQSTDLAIRPPLDFVGTRPLRFDGHQSETPINRQQTVRPFPNGISERRSNTQVRALEDLLPVEQNSIPNAARLEQTRNKIARQIGSAATRGILSPVGPEIDLLAAPAKPQIDTGIFDSSATFEPDPSLARGTNTNLRITSSSDVQSSVDQESFASLANGLSCIEPKRVAIQNWATDMDPSVQIADLRSQLYGEFDQLNQKIAVELAKTYLHFGFGAEARQTLFLHEDVFTQHPELVIMADILEYGHSRDSDYLSGYMECDSEIALWAILATESIRPTVSVNANAALRAVSALPMHLRIFLAPKLSRRLLAYGDSSSAAAALRSLERTGQPLNPNANLAKADLELAQKDVEQAQERLAEVVTSNTEQSAEALIKFVDSHLAEDAEIDENVATLVEAYALEMRDDPIETDLRRTHVLALGKSGQFTKAFDALSRIRARNSESGEDVLRSSVLDLLARNADDVEFLEHTFVQIGVDPETLTPQARLQLADRLTQLGFAKQAETVLNAGQGYKNSGKVALLKAEISMALNRPYEALAHLFGQESDAATLLRARAESLAGDFSGAHSIYSALEDTQSAQQTAWLSEDWSVLVEDATPVFGPMVSVAQSTIEDEPQKDGMLERAAAAISESQNARLAIEDLLTADELRVPVGE